MTRLPAGARGRKRYFCEGNIINISFGDIVALFILRSSWCCTTRDAGRSIIGGGGHIFIYSCYAQLISFEIEIKILKSIVFTWSVNKNI